MVLRRVSDTARFVGMTSCAEKETLIARSCRMFATYLANTLVFIVGTTTEIEIPIGFSVAFACVLANRLCLNTRGMIRDERSGTSSGSLSSDGPSGHTFSPRVNVRRHTYDCVEDWEEDGYDDEGEYQSVYVDGHGTYDGLSPSRRQVVSDSSTPARSPFTAEVEGGERLGAIQMRELRRMRSARLRERGLSLGLGSGGRWAGGVRIGRGAKREGIGEESLTEREGVGVATV